MRTSQKIVSWETLKRKIARDRKQGKKISFTNGCFDILHFGHVSYLEAAKKLNRVLVVGLNSDSSVKRLKGPQRPINSQKERAHVLAALECVDYVTIFNDDTPYELIKAVKPDVLIKGSDWKGKEVAGSDVVIQNGGKIEFAKYLTSYSTTHTIAMIQK